jgi:transglutaminase-like putative cysteine protease
MRIRWQVRAFVSRLVLAHSALVLALVTITVTGAGAGAGCSGDADGFQSLDPQTSAEIERRRRIDYSLDEAAMLAKLQSTIPNVTLDDLHRWRDDGHLQHAVFDGQVWYFRREPSNLLRFSAEARRRVDAVDSSESVGSNHSRFSLLNHIRQLVAESEQTDATEIHPIHHRVRYALVVPAGHPRVTPGATVRCWLPFPQEVDQQRAVRLVSSNPRVSEIAPNLHAQRSAYFEHQVKETGEALRFEMTVEFVTAAVYPKLDSSMAQDLDSTNAELTRYLKARPPHVPLNSEVRRLANRIVAGERNPLTRARRLFRWVCENIQYCSELEYSTIPSLTTKALNTRKGDCGVQAMTFISLCRAAGIPARWQSGWESLPGRRNMHDWAQFYVEPWGWLPADPSYGLYEDDDPRVAEFYFGHMDPYRMIVNLDYSRPFSPPKTSFRSEPIDFQRGEIEIGGVNLYFNEWEWECEVETKAAMNGLGQSATTSIATPNKQHATTPGYRKGNGH